MRKADPIRQAVLADRRMVRDVLRGRMCWHVSQSSTSIPFIRAAHAEAAEVLRLAISEIELSWREADKKARKQCKK